MKTSPTGCRFPSLKRKTMTDIEREAYRNEIDFLQHEVERYKEQNKQLMEIIFKLKDKQE